MDVLTTRITGAYINSKVNLPLLGRWTGLKNVPLQIGSGALNFYGYNLYNANTVDIFLKLYDSSSPPTVGSDTVIETIHVPAGSSAVLKGVDIQHHFESGLWVAFTTGVADTDSGAPAVGSLCQIVYFQ